MASSLSPVPAASANVDPPASPAADPAATKGQITLGLLAVYLVWGSTYLGIRVAIESLPPMLMAGTRFFVAGLLMMAFARLRWQTPWPTPRQWRDAGIVGGCLLLAGNGGVTLAERHLPSGLVALLVTTVPMFLLLFGWWAGMSPRPGLPILGSLALGWVGVGLLVHPSSVPVAGAAAAPTNGIRFYGDAALVLGAAAVWAAGSLYAKRADKPASAVQAVGAQMLLGGAMQLLAGTLAGEWALLHPAAVTARSLWALLYLTLCGSLVGFSAYVWLLGVCSPSLVGTYAFVNPAVAVGLGWWLLGEPVSPAMGLGMGIILTAVALIVLWPGKPRPA